MKSLSYKCQHSNLYGVVGDPSNEAHVTLELPVAMGNNYVCIACRCCGPQ
jgi:hypothetical protein